MELFRTMTRAEYFDTLENGWCMGGDSGGMMAKWFAENYEDAVEFGHKLGHLDGDSKFCVVGFEIDDDIAKKACIADSDLDGIGKSRAIEIDDLNKKPTKVTSVNSHRVKYK